MPLDDVLNRLAQIPAFDGAVRQVRAGMERIAFDFTRAMFTIAKYNDGLYESAAQGRAALEYAKTQNKYPSESEAWARTVKGYDRREMRSIAVVQQRYSKVYYFLLDRAGVVAWTSSKLRKDGTLPKSRKLKFQRPKLNAAPVATDDAPIMGDVVEGTYDVEGKVVSTKSNRRGPAMLLSVVKDGVQFRLFGNLTPELIDTYGVAPSKGTRVSFRADVRRSNRDTGFGFFDPVVSAEEREARGEVPTGDASLQAAEIIAVRREVGDYGPYMKMRLKAKDPFGLPIEVEGTLPAKILRRVSDPQDLVGKHLSFGAKFKPSRRDPAFGYFSRAKQIDFSSVQTLISRGRDVLSIDVQEAAALLVVNNPFEDYMITDFEDGEVEVERKAGSLLVRWDRIDHESGTQEMLLDDPDMEDFSLYEWANAFYEAAEIYKKDLDRVINFSSLYDRGTRRSLTFEDREGREHKVTLDINTYPSYKLTVRYDDENAPRVFEVANLG